MEGCNNMSETESNSVAFREIRSEAYLYGAHLSEVVRPQIVCQRHLHHMMFELNLVLEGSQTLIIDDRVFEQHAGDLVVIPPMLLHQYRVDQESPMKYFVAHIKMVEPVFLQKLMLASQHIMQPRNVLSLQLKPFVNKLLEQLKKQDSAVSILHTVFKISHQIEQFCEQESVVLQLDQELSYHIARKIEKLLVPSVGEDSVISQNWFEHIASELGFSRRHCSRVFREAYHLSPRDYLAVLRQQEAMQILLNSEESVEQIAYRIGFENVQSFIRQFTKWTGVTPGLFRKTRQASINYLTPLEIHT